MMMLRKSLSHAHFSLTFTLFNPSLHLLHLSVQLRHVEVVLPVSHLHDRFCLFKTNNSAISATVGASRRGVTLQK